MKEAKRILRKNRKPLLLIGMLLVLNAAASVAAGYSLSGIINAYEAEGDRIRALLRAALVCIGMYSLYMLINYAAEISVYRIERTLKNDLPQAVQPLPCSADRPGFRSIRLVAQRRRGYPV